jgi:hypothetical protein
MFLFLAHLEIIQLFGTLMYFIVFYRIVMYLIMESYFNPFIQNLLSKLFIQSLHTFINHLLLKFHSLICA